MVSEDPRSHTMAIQALIEAAAVGERRTSNIRDSFIRVRDLEDMGIIEIARDRFNIKGRGVSYVMGDPLHSRNGDFWYNALAGTFRGKIAGEIVDIPGSGVGGAGDWGDIGGTLSDQTDLQAALDAKADATDFASGTYTPTLTNVANLDSSTAFQCQYLRVGSVVTVTGKVTVDATAPGVQCQLGMALPIASNFGAQENCGGAAYATQVSGLGAAVRADATNNRAEFAWISPSTGSQNLYFSFSYVVI
jgi:hypothetical protein